MIKDFLARLLPANIAGILGVVQVVFPLARELIIVVMRIVAVFIPSIGVLIPKVVDSLSAIEAGFEKFKNIFLGD